MPYVKQVVRNGLDSSIDALAENIIRMYKNEGRDRDGMLNYVITKLMVKIYPNVSYKTINECIGVLECAKMEFYRRLASPYENSKIEENGDVFPSI